MSVVAPNESADDQVIQSYLSFKLDEELFAVDVIKVIEILEVPKITRIPRAPNYMAGIINLRGKVLPLVDTRVKFGLEPIEYAIDTCIVVIEIEVEGELLQIGTLVDAVLEVLEINQSKIMPSPTIEAKYRLDFIEGMFQREDDFIMLLNLSEVFSIEDVQFMQETDKIAQ
ncbi:MAG: purine-binding chemotaxis protein CheW [Cyclobacteriaceae bacterium]